MLQLLLLGVFLSVMLAVMAVGSGFSSRRRLAVRRALKQSRERNPKAYEGPGATFSSAIRGALTQLAFLFPDSAELRLKLAATEVLLRTRTRRAFWNGVKVTAFAAVLLWWLV